MTSKWLLAVLLATTGSVAQAEEPMESLICDAGDIGPTGFQNSELTPLAGPRVQKMAEFFLTADFIYWQARQENMEFAEDGDFNFTGIAATNHPHHGRVYNLGYDFEPGLKAGLGVDFRHDGWDLYLNYTWLQENSAKGKASFHADRGQLLSIWTLNPSSTLVYSPTAITEAHAKWKLHLNAFDLELGRNFYISRHLALRPHFGMKGSWMLQRLRVDYDVPVQTDVTSPLEIKAHNDQNFWGVGLRAGLNSQWHFTRNWSIYGNIAVAELYGQFENKRKDEHHNLSSGIETVGFYATNQFHTIKPVLEMSLGLRYETFFSNDRYQLFFQAGWEEQVWFGQNQLIDIGDQAANGDLVMQGLDMKLGFTF